MKNPSAFSLKLLQRKQALLKNFQENQAILLSLPADITYFTGFDTFLVNNEREALVYLSHKKTALIHPHFTPITKLENVEYFMGCHEPFLTKNLTQLLNQDRISELVIDQTSLFVGEFFNLQKLARIKTSVLDKKLIWQQRLIKDKAEIKKIEKAKRITQKILHNILQNLQVGMSEKCVAWSFEIETKKLPYTTLAFPTIVAFGAHSASPHHQPSNRKLQANTPVLIDCGVKYQNYCADMTRTIWFGNKPDPQFSKIEAVVKKAYQAAKNELGKVKTGAEITAARLDQAARQVIISAGYGPNFTHTTGHGLGLEIHEPPSLNSQNQALIKPGMTITLEPGIYLKNKFGYRFENTFLV